MAFRQYPDNLAVVICTGGDNKIDLGSVDPDEDQQLQVFGLQIFKRGLQPLVRMRINAYVSDILEATSEDVVVGTIENEYPDTDNFYGWTRFTFSPRLNLNSGVDTRFELELESYVYTPETVFIAGVLDWPVQMAYNNNPGRASSAPMAIELYGAI